MKIRIRNFRSLIDTGDIDLKPITVLVGKNSSGKSSFIRTFPLLKQSAEERTVSPILLYGRYVDFGSYNDIKPKYQDSTQGTYSLIFTFYTSEINNLGSHRRITRGQKSVKSVKSEIIHSVEFKEDKKQSLYIYKVKISLLDNVFVLTINNDKKRVESFKVNDELIFTEDDNIRYVDSGGFYYDLYTRKKIRRDSTEDFFTKEDIRVILKNKIISFLKTYLSGNTKDSTAWEIVRNVTLDKDENLLSQLKNSGGLATWTRKTRFWKTSSPTFIKLKCLLFAYYLHESVVDNLDLYLRFLSYNTKYLAPLRATAERYYRIQHLAVDEVDPNGKNLPIFIDSLSENLLASLNKWTEEYFDFKVRIHKIEGHYSIIILKGETETNLSDMGFGYSQILPILVQIWHSIIAPVRSKFIYSSHYSPQIIAIEQPELHLHPEFQAKFADSIVKMVKFAEEKGSNISLVIETHSDVIINRLGECVQAGEIKNSDIEIVLFEKKASDLPTHIRKSYFDKQGRLTDWPFGFFQPSRK